MPEAERPGGFDFGQPLDQPREEEEEEEEDDHPHND